MKHPSIHDEYLVSQIDGKHYKVLSQHVKRHGYTPETYRETFDLPNDYPMVAPGFSARRSELSRQIDHSNRWDPNTNMSLSARPATGEPYRRSSRVGMRDGKSPKED